jgi:hypothetical protein
MASRAADRRPFPPRPPAAPSSWPSSRRRRAGCTQVSTGRREGPRGARTRTYPAPRERMSRMPPWRANEHARVEELDDVQNAEMLERSAAVPRGPAQRERSAPEQGRDVGVEQEVGAGPIDARHGRQINLDAFRSRGDRAQQMEQTIRRGRGECAMETRDLTSRCRRNGRAPAGAPHRSPARARRRQRAKVRHAATSEVGIDHAPSGLVGRKGSGETTAGRRASLRDAAWNAGGRQ